MPLVHILAPQILRRVQQLEAEASAPYPPSPAYPTSRGYLQTIGYEKTPFDPNGVMDKPKESRPFDPRDAATAGGMQNALGYFQRSGDPMQQAFAKGAFIGMDKANLGSRGVLPVPSGPIAEPVTPNKRGVIMAAPGEPVAVNERGESLDIKGKKIPKKAGYLAQPALITPAGDIPLRTGERRYSDVIMGHKPGELEQTDPFAVQALEQRYGEHYRQSDVDRYGMPNLKFPDGYFKGKSKEEIDDIKSGVKALAALQRGTKT